MTQFANKAWGAILLGCASISTGAQPPQLQPVPFSSVDIRSEFWATRQRVNRERTIPHLIDMCEREGRVRNLWRAAGKLDGDFEGTRTHDADLFKVIEAASYTLARDFDSQLDRKLDELIAAVATAQRDDGYLHTYSQLQGRRGRRSKLNLFAAGHLIHAGAAHFEATGKRNLLTAAVRMADLILSLAARGSQNATKRVKPKPLAEVERPRHTVWPVNFRENCDGKKSVDGDSGAN